MNDIDIESELQANGKTAPRVTPADIEASILAEHYFTADEGVFGAKHNPFEPRPSGVVLGDCPLALLTFCVLELRNGFTVTGESACVSSLTFDAEIGRKVARKKAVDKIWPLLGYALKERLARKPSTPSPAV